MGAPIASTRVWHGDTPYDVSTMNRECSAVAAYGMLYAETLIFEVKQDGTRGHVLHQSEAASDSIAEHLQIVDNVRESGPYWDIADSA